MSAPAHLTTTPDQEKQIYTARAKIAYFGRMLFARGLTDSAGGNLSIRVGDKLCISPRYAGQQRQWQIDPEDVLVTDLNRNILDGVGLISREAHTHYALHNTFGEHGTAVIHAHARNILVFALAERPIPPTLEATRKFGTTPVVPFAPAHSPILAEHIVGTMRGREAMIKKHAAGTIAPWHGLFLMSKDMDAAFDAVERLDNSAYLLLMGGMAFGNAHIDAQLTRMEEVVGGFKE